MCNQFACKFVVVRTPVNLLKFLTKNQDLLLTTDLPIETLLTYWVKLVFILPTILINSKIFICQLKITIYN
jgi:hypothetical protein